MDDDGNKSLNLEEFMEGLTDYGLAVTKDDATTIFNAFDKDGSGTLNFDEFLIGVRPPMNASRVALVDQAFKKMDKSGDGVVTVKDLKGVYKVNEHPKYKNGQWDEAQVFAEYLKQFDEPNNPDGKFIMTGWEDCVRQEVTKDAQKVTREEFLNYYSAVSSSIDHDSYFDLMMRNSWKL